MHVDPSEQLPLDLSFPRDLRVDVQGSRQAEAQRGLLPTVARPCQSGPSSRSPALTSTTIWRWTFSAFQDMTDKLGGVYVEVDRRYFYDGWEYEPIDLQPGYQLLDGA